MFNLQFVCKWNPLVRRLTLTDAPYKRVCLPERVVASLSLAQVVDRLNSIITPSKM